VLHTASYQTQNWPITSETCYSLHHIKLTTDWFRVRCVTHCTISNSLLTDYEWDVLHTAPYRTHDWPITSETCYTLHHIKIMTDRLRVSRVTHCTISNSRLTDYEWDVLHTAPYQTHDWLITSEMCYTLHHIELTTDRLRVRRVTHCITSNSRLTNYEWDVLHTALYQTNDWPITSETCYTLHHIELTTD